MAQFDTSRGGFSTPPIPLTPLARITKIGALGSLDNKNPTLRREVLPRTWLTTLLAGAVLLPMAITLDVATACLFYGLQDLGMARVLFGVGVGLGLVWALDLAALTVVVGADALARGHEADESNPDEQ